MKLMWWLVLAAVFPVAANEPAWLAEARVREAAEMEPIRLKSADGKFHATVAAKLLTQKIEEVEGSYTLTFDVGGPSALDCELYLSGIDVAGHLRAVPPHVFAYVEQNQGKLEFKAIESMDGGVLGDWPFLAAHWLYRVNDGESVKLGALQQIVAENSGVSLSCQFVAIGYSKTIRRVIASLLDSLELAEPGPQPYYTETAVLETGGKPIGLARVEMTRDSDGDTEISSELAMLAVSPDGSPNSYDTVFVKWAKPDGELINAVHVQAQNGDVTSELRLTMQEGDWQVSGTFNSKEFSARIPGDQEPETQISQAYALKQRLAADDAVGSQLESLRWTPSADPSRFVQATTTVSEDLGAGQFAVLETMAGMDVNYVAEAETGSVVNARFLAGPAEVNLRRVHKTGSF